MSRISTRLHSKALKLLDSESPLHHRNRTTKIHSSRLSFAYQLSPTPLMYSMARQRTQKKSSLNKQKKSREKVITFDYQSDEDTFPVINLKKTLLNRKKHLSQSKSIHDHDKYAKMCSDNNKVLPRATGVCKSTRNKQKSKNCDGSVHDCVSGNMKLHENEKLDQEKPSIVNLNSPLDCCNVLEASESDCCAVTNVYDETKDKNFIDTIPNAKMKLESSIHMQKYLLGRSHLISPEVETCTVVHNVRQVHQCLRHGETLQFRDELEYLLDSMKFGQPLYVRCLSTLNLAQECLKGDFVRQIRSHGLTKKVLFQLKDAKDHLNVQIALGTLLYIMIQNGIGYELDRNCIEMLSSLIAVDDSNASSLDHKSSQEFARIRKKSKSLLERCSSICLGNKSDYETSGDPPFNNANSLLPTKLTVGELISECLINMTENLVCSHWLREELRELGIIDHITSKAITTTILCCEYFFRHVTEEEIEIKLMKLIRLLKLLENVSFMSKGNQSYLIVFDCSTFVSELSKFLVILGTKLQEANPLQFLMVECLLGGLRVFLNLTHDNELGSYRIGEQQNLLNALLNIILKLPMRIGSPSRFDVLVLSLCLFINLIKDSDINQQQLLTAYIEDSSVGSNDPYSGMLATKAITKLFLTHYHQVEFANIEVPSPQAHSIKPCDAKVETRSTLFSRLMHQNTKTDILNRIPTKHGVQEKGDDLEPTLTESDISSDHDDDEYEETPPVINRQDFDMALAKAGSYMEDCIISSYSALTLAVLAKNSLEFATSLKQDLPSGNYSSLIKILNEFLSFMNLAATNSTRSGLEAIRKILKFLEHSDNI